MWHFCYTVHDRIVVLVIVSKAESIVLCLSSCIMYRPVHVCQNKDFLPSFLHSHATIFGSSVLHPR